MISPPFHDRLGACGLKRVRLRCEPAPFFASLGVQPPHDPYTAPPEFMARHNAGSIRFRQNVPKLDWVREQAASRPTSSMDRRN
ncbi:MAG: hypothetical protein ACLFP4_13115 [Spirochaetales bacterium]